MSQTLETLEANPVRGFTVTGLGGGLAFVAPYGAALSARQAEALRRAAGFTGDRPKVAQAIAGRLQRELGVTQELHQEAVAFAGRRLAERFRQERHAARALEVRRAEDLQRRTTAPKASEVVETMLADLSHAEARLAEARGAKDRRAIKLALADVRKLQGRAARLRQGHLDEVWAARAQSETVELATARGEAVAWDRDAETGEVQMRVSSRDGLLTLFESGSITAVQYRAGRAYRLCYEAAAKGLRVSNVMASGGSAGASSADLQRAYMVARLAGMEMAARQVSGGERRLALLRSIAGEGRTVSDLAGQGGDARKRCRETLALALQSVADLLGLANQAG